MEKIRKFEDLTVWQKSHKLVLETYKMTGSFPQDERFGLISQMRRAAVSITANIAEGFRKNGQRDKINFYNIAQGSADELKYYFILAKDLKYTSNSENLLFLLEEVEKMLSGLVSSIKGKNTTSSLATHY